MAKTGLAYVLSAVFGGVAKMLTGKKFPQNVRAMRLVAGAITPNYTGYIQEGPDEGAGSTGEQN
jgi:hypothetical protein